MAVAIKTDVATDGAWKLSKWPSLLQLFRLDGTEKLRRLSEAERSSVRSGIFVESHPGKQSRTVGATYLT